MPDQQLDAIDGDGAKDKKHVKALSDFKAMVHALVEMTGLSTNQLADMYRFGKGKVSTWQTAKPDQPNIPPLRFVEVLIKEAQERGDLKDEAAAAFLHQYGELLKLYCARANPHHVHIQMLAEYQNTFLIRRLNGEMTAAREKIVELTERLEMLREDRDEEHRLREALQQQIDALQAQNQSLAVEKKAALARRDQVRDSLAAYESDQELQVRQPAADQGGSHTDQPPALAPGRDPKRRGLVLSLIAAGVVIVALAVYVGTQMPGDHNDAKATASPPDRSAPPSRSASATASAGTSATATPPGAAAAGGSTSGSGGSSNGATGGSTGSSVNAGASGGAPPADNKGPSHAPTTPSPKTVSRLQNASTHQCLSGDGSVFTDVGTCGSSDAYAWTFVASGGGTFELVNRASGYCLSAPYANDFRTGLESCSGPDGTGYVHWHLGTTAAGQTLKNTESGHCLAINSPPGGGAKQAMVTTCNSDQSQQLWTRG